jgi:phosphocarrier protein FPr
MLDVRQGDEIRITASGLEADQSIRALREMIEHNFGEGMEDRSAPVESGPPLSDERINRPQEAGPGAYSGIPISAGVAIAPLYHLKRAINAVDNSPAENPETEWTLLEQALQRVKDDLLERQAALQQQLGDEQAAILEAHRLILADPELVQQVRLRISQEGIRAASAWAGAIWHLEERYRELADPVMKQRAADIEDVGRQVLAALAGKIARIEIPGSIPVILYADELSPSETAQLDMNRAAGLVTTCGTGTSHSAILARALGIPAVSGIDRSMTNIQDGTLLVLDGDQGLVWIDPSMKIRARYEARMQSWAAEHTAWLASSQKPARLKNGRRIEILANIGSPDEARLAIAQGAEGVGLLRTEFLFFSRRQAPEEEEQVAALRAVGQALEGRPLIVRTLDAGGDKDLPYLAATGEANPFLGVRAIRLSLRHTALFQAQLRAILRAASEYPLRIMFPMIANLRDLHMALEQLEIAHATLSEEHLPHHWPIETGIMIEVPSAALLSDRFAPLVDFFSIGTNDLTQYTLAADRGNRSLAEYNDALHPAVLNLVQQVVRNGKRYGKRVGICGEMASDPQAAPVLVGLGLDEFSLNPSAIPRIKETIRTIEEASAVLLAENALQMNSAASVRDAAQNFLKGAD